MTLRLVLLGLNLLFLVGIVLLYRRVKQTQPSRRVDAPSSLQESPNTKDRKATESWEQLDLDKMHKVNREEVERVLEKLRDPSIVAITPSERAFLDRMVEAERRSAG